MFSDNDLFHGVVTGHSVGKTRNGDLKLVLKVDLISKCLDRWNPEMGEIPCPNLKKVESWIIFTADDEDKMAKRADVLASLGFDGDDLSRLIPGRKNSFEFKGRKCLVRPRIYGDS